MSELEANLATGSVESSIEWATAAPLVEDLLRTLGSTLRSYRLYSGKGPALDRFIRILSDKFAALWEVLPRLRLEIDEQSMHWEDQKVYPSGDSGGELAFLFYKDGIRSLTFMPGFEAQVERLLAVMGRAPQVQQDEDDLITLLWQENLDSFHYEYVEIAAESLELGGSTGSGPASVSPSDVKEEAATAISGLMPEDFQETLYFLDEGELRKLQEEVRREASRDLWTDVLNGLYDRLEDSGAERQVRIIKVFAELLPTMLGGREFKRAAALLGQIADLASRPGLFSASVLREVQQVFGQLAEPATVIELVKTLEFAPNALQTQGLAELLSFFPPAAIAPLTRSVATVTRPDVKRTLEAAVQHLVEANRDEVVRLLSDADPTVVAGAAHWVGSLRIGSATAEIVPLLVHTHPLVRRAAIDALVELGAAAACDSVVPLLADPDREVRVAAVRALSALQYTAASPALQGAIESKRIRAADRTEKIALFEAYGSLAGLEAIGPLDKILNAKGWLGQREAPEFRACAALGLARVRHASARAALTRAAKDSEAVVRSAVARALREMTI